MNHFPFIKQHDAMECGVACLAMVGNLVLMKQLYNLDYELSAEESVLINFGRLITLVFFIGIKIIL